MKTPLSSSALAVIFVLWSAILSAAPANSQTEKWRQYDIVFEGRGTYSADATGIGTEFYHSMHQEITMAWKTTYTSVWWDETGGDPSEPLGVGTANIILSGTLQETGTSSRECTNPGSYSCTGSSPEFVQPCSHDPQIYVMKALQPGFLFTVDGLDHQSAGVCYGPECTGCYTAYTSQAALLQPGAFAASFFVAPGDLKKGKVIYRVTGPNSAVPACVDDERPTCSQSLSWTGDVSLTLLRDNLPPYVRPKSTALRATKTWKVSTKLESAHEQMGPATGTLTLTAVNGGAAYGEAAFKIAHGRSSASVNIPLNSGAKRILMRGGSLKCIAKIKTKDAYGAATVKTKVTIRAP